MAMTMQRLSVSMGLALICGFSASGSAERLVVRAELTAGFHSVAITFSDRQPQGDGVVFRGEPIEVDLYVTNSGRGPAFLAVERDWYQRLAFSVREGTRHHVGRTVSSEAECTP
jgi:hypothetical protein